MSGCIRKIPLWNRYNRTRARHKFTADGCIPLWDSVAHYVLYDYIFFKREKNEKMLTDQKEKKKKGGVVLTSPRKKLPAINLEFLSM